jgi:Xaa-Pro dipeptidase
MKEPTVYASSRPETISPETVLTQRPSRQVKQERVHDFLSEHRLEGILLRLQRNFAWYTGGARGFVNLGIESSIAELLITHSEEHLFVNTTEGVRLAGEELPWSIQHEHLNAWWDDSKRPRVVKTLFRNGIESDTGRLRVRVARLRYSLLPDEVERYRELGRDVAATLRETAQIAHVGVTEFDLAAELSSRLVRTGIYPIVLLVGFDDRLTAYRHPLPTMNKLKKLAMVAVCGRRSGLVASASRLVSLGALSPDLRARHRAVVSVDAWLLQHTVPGARVADLFSGLKAEYARHGYPNEWQFHHQGGATGYSVRDYRASDSSKEVVQLNQAFAWNPTIAGTKSEDTIVAKESGFEILTHDPLWPMLEVNLDGAVIKRPDILILD